MKNDLFDIAFDRERGTLSALSLVGDPERANFIKPPHGLGELGSTLWFTHIGDEWTKAEETWKFVSFDEGEREACAVFAWHGVRATERFILTERDLRVRIEFLNENAYPMYFEREDVSLFVPFADSYDDSETCQKIRCHEHISAAMDNTYIRAERMGFSPYNVGVVFLRGAAYSYSQDFIKQSNDRGYLRLNIEPFSLLSEETYEIEFAVFSHTGGLDFFRAAAEYPAFIRVESERGFVLMQHEESVLTLSTGCEIGRVSVRCGGKKLPFKVDGHTVRVPLSFATVGERTIEFSINGRRGTAVFFVSAPLAVLQKKRAEFIVRHQQCTDPKSPLYGAYLIYDNEEEHTYFSYEWTDHNANRERLGMAVFLAKYLRLTGDKKIERSLSLFTDFLLRECVDEEDGRTYNNIGKDKSVKRLYNAPWVILYFCELYLYNREQRWIDLAFKMILSYYQNGGTKFYPNGIRFYEMWQAFRLSGQTEKCDAVWQQFTEHVENILKNQTNYPPHEVNYEQSIATAAALLTLDHAILTGDRSHMDEIRAHLALLYKFNGCQPDYRLNAVPIRYWDNYWFGKRHTGVYGDTLPHPALAHSAHVFMTYGKLTGDETALDYGEKSWRAGYCLFDTRGRASSAYVYPARANGVRGAFFDPFADEQDGFLYLAYKKEEEI